MGKMDPAIRHWSIPEQQATIIVACSRLLIVPYQSALCPLVLT